MRSRCRVRSLAFSSLLFCSLARAKRLRSLSRAMCCRDRPDRRCQCEDIFFHCERRRWQQLCVDSREQAPASFHSHVRNLLQARPRVQQCKWDATEVLLKASIYSDEHELLKGWVLAWVQNMDCFPRLHVVSDNSTLTADVFRAVPNVTFHNLRYPFLMDDFYAIQWPMMWADNFTSARHVLVFDADSPLMLPLRCHHVFDPDGRPVWRSWRTHHAWTRTSDAIGLGLTASSQSYGHGKLLPRGLDLMTFFPVVIPSGHPEGRRFPGMQRGAVLRREGACSDFDRAWMALGRPSYADLLGKASSLLGPPGAMLKIEHCRQKPNGSCLHFVPAAEHLKHPHQGAHAGAKNQRHYFVRSEAVRYGERLAKVAAEFALGGGRPVPSAMFHYNVSRSVALRVALGSRLLRNDPPGHTCGKQELPQETRSFMS